MQFNLEAANAQRLREYTAEWLALNPIPEEVWAYFAEEFARDARKALPGDQDEMEAAWLDRHEQLEQKGAYYRLGAWFSIIPAVAARDSHWKYWQLFLRWLSRAIMGPSEAAAKAREAALAEAVAAVAKASEEDQINVESHKRQMRDLRKAAGNSLILAGLMLHNLNWFNCRLLLHIGRQLYIEQGTKAKCKQTADEDLRHSISMAARGGVSLLQELWFSAVSDAGELGRLGLAASQTTVPQNFSPEVDYDTGEQMPGVLSAHIPQRVMSFLAHVTEARLWSQTWLFGSYPCAFAAILHPDPSVQREALESAKESLGWSGLYILQVVCYQLQPFCFVRIEPLNTKDCPLTVNKHHARDWDPENPSRGFDRFSE